MNQLKIGKFIQERRKLKNLTQAQLSEKLGITDRAISKWENGRGLPDVSLMVELCAILEISVNELLCGAVIEMSDYKKKTQELLLEMTKREEKNNKKLFLAMWLILITDVLFLSAVLIPASIFLGESTEFYIVMAITMVIFIVIAFIALKFEVDAGYYQCKQCGHKFVPTYIEVVMSMHFGTTRHLKCPKCNKRHWCKKVIK